MLRSATLTPRVDSKLAVVQNRVNSVIFYDTSVYIFVYYYLFFLYIFIFISWLVVTPLWDPVRYITL